MIMAAMTVTVKLGSSILAMIDNMRLIGLGLGVESNNKYRGSE